MEWLKSSFIIAFLTLPTLGHSQNAAPLTESESWDDIRYVLFEDNPIANGADLFEFEAPKRAEDAAIVPIRIVQKNDQDIIKSLALVVDENPAPVVAEITLGSAMSPLDFETRVRVNQYSNVRAILETDTGLFMNGAFVKASGGCSAPATKDPEAALKGIGAMRARFFDEASAPQSSQKRQEAQIMIQHPNYSGLQRDQITHLFISAHFINTLKVYQGDELLFALEGGISISENPSFRFTYTDNGATTLKVIAEDTDGNTFEQNFEKQ